jgi:hypothetical protein
VKERRRNFTKIKIGEIYKSNRCGEFKVIEQIKFDLFKIQFTANVYFSAIKNGCLKDNLIPYVCKIGCLGYANKNDNIIAYRKWRNMLSRCYDINNKNYPQYGKKGVRVCDRWLRFDYFLEDLKEIEGYNEELFNEGILELDKDIKQFTLNNKIYSKETCCFVTTKNNNLYREYSIQKPFIAISPDGSIHNGKNIREFCRMYHLTATHVSRCLRNLSEYHKGWQFKYIGGN